MRRLGPAAALLCCALAARARAQEPAADSARVAREAYRQAIPFYRRGEWAAARERLRRASTAWPAQPAYLTAYAAVSARLLDTAETVRALALLADYGLAADLAADSDFAALREAPALQPVRARFAANLAPLPSSSVAATLAEPDFWPEGISHDPGAGVWYLASVRHRKVTRVARDGSARDLVGEAQDSLWAVLGVRADPARGTLWVTTAAIPQMAGYSPADSGRSALVAFDLATGRRKARYELPGRNHLLGDLVVAGNGDVYATDSQDPAIWLVRRGADRAEEFLRHPLFRSLQGPAIDPAGRILYVADYSHGVLAVDLATRSVRALAAPPGSTVLGIDGLSWHAGALIAVQNGFTPPRILRLRLAPGGGAIAAVELLDRHLPQAAEPTIGTVWGDRFYYVANSQWEEYDGAGRLRPGIRLEPPVILELRLP